MEKMEINIVCYKIANVLYNRKDNKEISFGDWYETKYKVILDLVKELMAMGLNVNEIETIRDLYYNNQNDLVSYLTSLPTIGNGVKVDRVILKFDSFDMLV